MRQYWRFYWPLALTGVATVLAIQFQNAALARYPGAVTELAVFALATSVFGLFASGLNFASQLANVFARSKRGLRLSRRFIAAWSIALSLPLAAIGVTDAGARGIELVFGIETELALRVHEYLLYMLPLLFVTGQRFYLTGLLVQGRHTGWVTILNVAFLASAGSALVVGFALQLVPVATLVGAQVVSGLLHWGLSELVVRSRYRLPDVAEQERTSVLDLVRFFLPMTATGLMFAISRPVLFAFVARMPDGIAAIAALRVAFDFSHMFQQAANQFRHFFVTFGLDHLAAKRRFMALVCAGITGIMLAVALTPLSDWILGRLLGVRGPVLAHAVEAVLVLCLMPAVIVVRNYYHGLLMVRRRTTGMAVGGALRVLAMAALAQTAYWLGGLDHNVAAFILLLGFAVETLAVLVSARRAG